MATNPPPADGARSQAVYDLGKEQFRARSDDERTETGFGIDHNKWIVCPAIGVGGRCTNACTVQSAASHASLPARPHPLWVWAWAGVLEGIGEAR